MTNPYEDPHLKALRGFRLGQAAVSAPVPWWKVWAVIGLMLAGTAFGVLAGWQLRGIFS